jgi:hypothetical protein
MDDNMKQRSTGEVAAPDRRTILGCPHDESPCETWPACKSRQEFNAKLSAGLDAVEQLATSVERAAVVKYLRAAAKRRTGTMEGRSQADLYYTADCIEKGEHVK